MITDPVVKQEPICESERVKVFLGENPMRFRVECERPDGTVQVFEEVKAYTESIKVTESGAVSIKIGSQIPRIRASIPYPYHYISKKGILCALKLYDVKTMADEGIITFALNYNLFCEPWEMAIIVHNFKGERMVFATSRAEWDRGQLGIKNREVQMFLPVPHERQIPLRYYKLQVSKDILFWIQRIEESMTRKGA